MQQIDIRIEGMTCGGCAASVTRALKAVPGVEEVNVSLAPGQAQVRFDPADTDRKELEQVIEEAGYDVVR
ncbi:cation transporter [Chitiniphilus purpureus]|uniref:Cation transporter n=1 Tax=Chitiniphilus purpureus TaxID=2981137 RepID=A0ABY6DIM0_9NEIS|nr:heavy-metal-associated domain-containing protein [Chitiniphilus sp. CD1]UXY14195.1 cation transporter [Chitiniphilus sp. CD1]